MRKNWMKIYSRVLKTHVSSVMKALTNSVSYCKKVFIHMSRWMSGKDSMRRYEPQTLPTNMLKSVKKYFRMRNLGQYSDLHVQSDTLLFADMFKSFRKKCLEFYKLQSLS